MKINSLKQDPKYSNFKSYAYGFIKGFGVMSLYFFILLMYVLILLEARNLPTDDISQVITSRFNILAWLVGVALVYYLVKKNKLMKGWLLVGAIFTVYTIPFIMGYVEMKRRNSKLKL